MIVLSWLAEFGAAMRACRRNSARAARAARVKGKGGRGGRGLGPEPSKQAELEFTLQRQEALPCLRDRDSERVGGKNAEKPKRLRPNPNRMRKGKE